MLSDKRVCGIAWGILYAAGFMAATIVARNLFDGTLWYLCSSLLRIVFGVAILYKAEDLYQKTDREILSLRGSKAALVAGAGFLLYSAYYLVLMAIEAKAVRGLTVGLFVSEVILQQFATGFYEELNYRYLICEGYFHGKPGRARRFLYALLSFVLFGAVHVINGWSTFTFLATGAIGFAFAVMYLQSRNILVPMILHAVYDVFANLAAYTERRSSLADLYTALIPAVAVMTLISAVMLARPIRDRETDSQTTPVN